MAERLLSVGLDVGTTTTQMIVSALTVENQANGFSVPRMEIVQRDILYKSPIHFTPLLSGELVDGQAIRQIVAEEYRLGGICRADVDTGAIIITGETSRKENARSVLEALSDFAGDFVVATAGPHLESVLAAKGSGAVELSQGKTVIHMDIGGGTTNLALLCDGEILATGCINVGGRLIRLADRTVIERAKVLDGLTDLQVGFPAGLQQLNALARLLVQALETAVGLGTEDALVQRLWTQECGDPSDWNAHIRELKQTPMLSFSGGVADCIEGTMSDFAFDDLGVILGKAIAQSRLCQGNYTLGKETIRATVIGAGCHSARLSGSTVFHRNVTFPLKNLTVTRHYSPDQEQILLVSPFDGDYAQLTRQAQAILQQCPTGPVYLAMEQDFAKALGQVLALQMPSDRPLLCLDRLQLKEGDYLDVAQPVGPALPVVIKTLVFSQE